MIEYLVRRTDGEWFDFPSGSDPYAPVSIAYRRTEGSGDARIEIDDCEISFSYEDPGIQISFEGDIPEDRAAQIADEVRLRIEETSGQSGELIQIGWNERKS